MSDTLPKGYEPADVEAKWRKRWRDDKTFTPDPAKGGDPYCIVIPPPNVTGALHIGHALNLTLIDTLCRHYRQKGKNVLWIPGTDHAGIATQNVVEKTLAKEGLRRQDLGREKFIERVWQWREEYGHRILSQIEALGCSVDWTRLRFTLDEGLSKAVRKVFVQLYNEGLIYRGKYIINWCSRCHTALADDEVEHSDEKGHLWKIRYHIKNSDESIVVATTRPETIPGDTAICVHPEDDRYASLVGKTALVPVLNREIPIIADKYVDREFGTGALKVTPCHDHNDWALGKTHNLEFIQVIDEDGIMKAEAGKYQGMTKQECRKSIVADIEAMGDLLGVEDLKALSLTEKDTVVGLAASGRTPYVSHALDYAKSVGAHTVAIACNKNSVIGQHADLAIEPVCGPEVLTGSTRLKAGTAQKLILNMISTASMVRAGKAYQNLMVDVMQTNEKLHVRAENIVIDATGVDRAEARRAIDAASGSVKCAITMLLAGCGAEEAARRLEEAGGHVRAAVGL